MIQTLLPFQIFVHLIPGFWKYIFFLEEMKNYFKIKHFTLIQFLYLEVIQM